MATSKVPVVHMENDDFHCWAYCSDCGTLAEDYPVSQRQMIQDLVIAHADWHLSASQEN